MSNTQNEKISNMSGATYIKDTALIPIVQDSSNKIITVSQLADKVNEKQNQIISKLWEDVQRATHSEFLIKSVKQLNNIVAKHEYRLGQSETLSLEAKKTVDILFHAVDELTAREKGNHHAIKHLERDVQDNRKAIAHLNRRIDILDPEKFTSYLNALVADLNETKEKHDTEISYINGWIESTTTYLTNTDNENFTYLCSYVHFGQAEYWQTATASDLLEYVGSKPTTPPCNSGTCGC